MNYFANTISRKEFLTSSVSLLISLLLLRAFKTLAGAKAVSQYLSEPFLIYDSLLHSAFRSKPKL